MNKSRYAWLATVGCVMCGTYVGSMQVDSPGAPLLALNIADPGLPARVVPIQYVRCPRCGSPNLCESDRESMRIPSTYDELADPDMPARRGRPPKALVAARKRREMELMTVEGIRRLLSGPAA